MYPDYQRGRRDVLSLIKKAIEAVEPTRLVRQYLDELQAGEPDFYLSYFGPNDRPVLVLGAGKAVTGMTAGLMARLDHRPVSGVIIGPENASNHEYGTITYFQGGHPLPDENGASGVQRMIKTIRSSGPETDVIVLISGGASVLMTSPVPPFSFDHIRRLNREIVLSGAPIHEINTIRKHCSVLAGGGLARLLYPRRVLTLIISDVIGDPVEMIGSGPTADDRSSIGDVFEIVRKYGLPQNLPFPLVTYLEQASSKRAAPRADLFQNVRNTIIASNETAVREVLDQAGSMGYQPIRLMGLEQGPVSELARAHLTELFRYRESHSRQSGPFLFVSGGEATLKVTGPGQGGRNQHFVLELVPEIAGLPLVAASIGTDGIDGNSEAAGAIADGLSLSRACERGLDVHNALGTFDSYHFFQALDDLIITGRTGTNVMDLRLFVLLPN
ncbi:DUF4147 domain-containing protein [bacterium]|nr:DUF4147 domain-containing protein [bacterium]